MTSLAFIASTDGTNGARALARADCVAVQMALQNDRHAAAVCPAGDKVAFEYALAAGIRNIHELNSSPPADFQIVYVGSGAAELLGDIYLARWAELSKASLLFDVMHCSEQRNGIRDVECDAGRGARYHLRVAGPLIMVMSSHVARPAYVSRYRRHSAAQLRSGELQPAHEQAAARMNTHDWNPVRPRVRVRHGQHGTSGADDRMNSAFSIEAAGQKDSSNVIVADPETCARHILRYLAHHGFVTHSSSDDQLEVPKVRERPAPTHATQSHATSSVRHSAHPTSLARFMERRPRQADDLPARRARQPRFLDESSRPSIMESVRGFLERRPRQPNDSAVRRACQPRPVERAEQENDV